MNIYHNVEVRCLTAVSTEQNIDAKDFISLILSDEFKDSF